MNIISQIVQNHWYIFFLGLILGVNLYMWADYFIRQKAAANEYMK